MHTSIIATVLLAATLPGQAAVTTNIGGGCQPVKEGFTKVSKAVIGKCWVLEWAFVEPWMPEAWLMLGVRNPDLPFGESGCRLRTSADVGILLGRSLRMGGQLKLRVPNDVTLIGTSVYAQGIWWAQRFPLALTDSYKVTVGK